VQKGTDLAERYLSLYLALKYSKTNEAKPNNPIIEMIMIPNSELSMLISR
jgi:hypothetical protein